MDRGSPPSSSSKTKRLPVGLRNDLGKLYLNMKHITIKNVVRKSFEKKNCPEKTLWPCIVELSKS